MVPVLLALANLLPLLLVLRLQLQHLAGPIFSPRVCQRVDLVLVPLCSPHVVVLVHELQTRAELRPGPDAEQLRAPMGDGLWVHQLLHHSMQGRSPLGVDQRGQVSGLSPVRPRVPAHQAHAELGDVGRAEAEGHHRRLCDKVEAQAARGLQRLGDVVRLLNLLPGVARAVHVPPQDHRALRAHVLLLQHRVVLPRQLHLNWIRGSLFAQDPIEEGVACELLRLVEDRPDLGADVLRRRGRQEGEERGGAAKENAIEVLDCLPSLPQAHAVYLHLRQAREGRARRADEDLALLVSDPARRVLHAEA
mmetsp:Transcript_60542/g.162067  ORF Transcript_60542/g.162067 Transcript_60542/m.162067 type:complete len:306 (+) Transcript_60542:519-1436(+)